MREIINIARARATDYSHTVNGLMTKRADLFNEAERIRDRLAEIKNDLGALDRTLTTLGYDGPLDDVMPRQKRQVIFGRGELTKGILAELRHAETPLGSREIAQLLVSSRGEDARDRKYITDLTRRVSKALRILKHEGVVRSAADNRGNLFWEMRLPSGKWIA